MAYERKVIRIKVFLGSFIQKIGKILFNFKIVKYIW